MSSIKILMEYLVTHLNQSMSNSEIITNVSIYGRDMYGKLFSPGTYDRKFRLIRENKLLETYGFEVTFDNSKPSRENHYIIIRIEPQGKLHE